MSECRARAQEDEDEDEEEQIEDSDDEDDEEEQIEDSDDEVEEDEGEEARSCQRTACRRTSTSCSYWPRSCTRSSSAPRGKGCFQARVRVKFFRNA